MNGSDRLPSWRPGPTRDALVGFLEDCTSIPVESRVAYFDNDGTLWCERPDYPQFLFYLDELRTRAAEDPSLGDRAEFAALLDGDMVAAAEIGLPRIGLALAGLFEGMTPETFTDLVRRFVNKARHSRFGTPLRGMVYRPMLELIDVLRNLDFTVGIVTGGGTEFVRAVSEDLYGVPPELVVGTLVAYDVELGNDGPTLRRTSRLQGDANEGPAKVANIQTQLGRRPVLAAGNSAGDREMLEWAMASPLPHLALLIDHDDETREYAYASEAGTFVEPEPITDIAARLGWTTVSMARDWASVFDV